MFATTGYVVPANSLNKIFSYIFFVPDDGSDKMKILRNFLKTKNIEINIK